MFYLTTHSTHCIYGYMHHPTGRIAHAIAFGKPDVQHWPKREMAQGVHPMMDRSDDTSHHKRALFPRNYISLPALKTSESAVQTSH